MVDTRDRNLHFNMNNAYDHLIDYSLAFLTALQKVDKQNLIKGGDLTNANAEGQRGEGDTGDWDERSVGGDNLNRPAGVGEASALTLRD